MKKHFVCYLILWLPAVLVSYLWNNPTTASQVAQWACAALLVAGWGLNTSIAAANHPRATLSLLLIYTGVNLLLITAKYSAKYDTIWYNILSKWGGLFSFAPLGVLVQALMDFNIPQELYVTVFLAAVCLLGFIIGLIYRRMHPNPYRPRIIRQKSF